MDKNCEACFRPKENREWHYCRSCSRRISREKWLKETAAQMSKYNQTTTGVEELDKQIARRFAR
jgi:hypothetical protein